MLLPLHAQEVWGDGDDILSEESAVTGLMVRGGTGIFFFFPTILDLYPILGEMRLCDEGVWTLWIIRRLTSAHCGCWLSHLVTSDGTIPPFIDYCRVLLGL